MSESEISPAPVTLDPQTGVLSGVGVTQSEKRLRELAGYFRDEAARVAMDPEILLYRVQSYEPQPEGVEGAICCATTFLMPGKVGDEYFMTRGHYHAAQDKPEMEVTVSGEGVLVLMDENRRIRAEIMRPGSVHPVPPRTAHRVANTGTQPLVFVSFWPSETGHDYDEIVSHGFSGRVREINGGPTLVPE
jgi:glucose-6-phosphate isomerase